MYIHLNVYEWVYVLRTCACTSMYADYGETRLPSLTNVLVKNKKYMEMFGEEKYAPTLSQPNLKQLNARTRL